MITYVRSSAIAEAQILLHLFGLALCDPYRMLTPCTPFCVRLANGAQKCLGYRKDMNDDERWLIARQKSNPTLDDNERIALPSVER